MTSTTNDVYDQGHPMDPLTLADLIQGADLTDLYQHGDTHTLVEGYDVRLVVEQDEDCSLEDEDPEVIGRLQWRNRDYGRPDGFNGAARILARERSEALWWQPIADSVTDPDAMDAQADWIRERLESGWLYVALELIGPAPEVAGWQYHDYHAHRPTITAAGVGGVDSIEHGHLAWLIQEQQGELEHHVRQIPESEHPTL